MAENTKTRRRPKRACDTIYCVGAYTDSGELHAIKIGTTSGDGLGHRLRDFQCGCPLRLELIGTLVGGQAKERSIHYRIRDRRIRGEWFRPDPEIIGWFQRGILGGSLDPAETLAARCRRAREERGFTRRGLARRAGLSPAMPDHIESGRITNPRLETGRKLAEALNVHAGWFLWGSGSDPFSHTDQAAE